MNIGAVSRSSGRSPSDRLELVDVVLEVADDESLADVADGHLAEPRMDADAVASAVGPARASVAQERSAPASIRSNSSRGGSVRSRSMIASRAASVATRPNGTGSGVTGRRRARARPARTASISATWASTSRGPQDAPRERVEPLRERPRRAGFHGRAERGRSRSRGGPDAIGRRRRSACRPVWHAEA